MKQLIKKIKDQTSEFAKDSKEEGREMSEMVKLMWAARRRKLTHEEKLKIEGESEDVLRLLFLSALFILPGSGILIIAIVKLGKKIGIRVLPSAFSKK